MKCAVDGCLWAFYTDENISPNARFICSHHSREEQMSAAGLVFDPGKDRKDADVHFQDHQFESHGSMVLPLLDEKNLVAGAADPTKRHVTYTSKRGN